MNLTDRHLMSLIGTQQVFSMFGVNKLELQDEKILMTTDFGECDDLIGILDADADEDDGLLELRRFMKDHGIKYMSFKAKEGYEVGSDKVVGKADDIVEAFGRFYKLTHIKL